MSLVINFTPSEEAQLSKAAKQTGLAPADFVRKLVKEHLPAIPVIDKEDLDSTLHKLQAQVDMTPMLDVATQALFANWAEEDAELTEEERADNERIYAEIEKNGIPRVQL